MAAANESAPGTRSEDVQVTVARPKRILHFSDGVEEEMEEDHTAQLNVAPKQALPVDPKTLTWGPWFSHYMWASGSKVVNAVDYVGEGLASFFGITTPKYQIEIDEHERLQEEKKQMDDESWVPKKTDGEIPLVTNAPSREVDRPAEV